MRYLEGEKHLVFVTERGIFLPRAEDDRNLASIASDARVALDIIHTGGVPGQSFDWRPMTSRTAAEETGGTYSSLSYAKDFVDRLDTATRFQYVLGYAPANTRLDNKFRNIRVSVVGRPGLQVLYRHGYFASAQLPPLDRRRVLSYSRVTTAAGYATEVHDIGLTATAANADGADAGHAVKVEIKIKPDRLSFKDIDGKKAGSVDVAIFCSDDKQRLIGQSWNVAELQMTPAAFERFMAAGLTYIRDGEGQRRSALRENRRLRLRRGRGGLGRRQDRQVRRSASKIMNPAILRGIRGVAAMRAAEEKEQSTLVHGASRTGAARPRLCRGDR